MNDLNEKHLSSSSSAENLSVPLPEIDELTKDSLQALLEVSQVLTSILDGKALLKKILEITVETVNAERGFLVLMTPDGRDFSVGAAHNIYEDEVTDPQRPSRDIVFRALEAGRSVLVHDAQTDPRFEGSESVIMNRITSAIAVPLIEHSKPVGAVYVDSRGDRGKFTEENKLFFDALASFAALAYQNASRFDQLQDEVEQLHTEVSRVFGFEEIIGVHPRMEEVFQLMRKILHSDITVLLQGESGTGKELVARALHYNGPRRNKPFLAQFCGNLSEQLLESELFGHKRGSFTGAVQDKRGLLEMADGGTFFLDEIADISPTIQAKLLRVLQDGVIRRVGGTDSHKVDVRIISATNKDLKREVEEGRFRDDLFYRLNVITIRMPAVRERRSDIPLLSDFFLQRAAEKHRIHRKRIKPEALKQMQDYHWPGNVRELQNAIERAVVLSGDSPYVELADLNLPNSGEEGQMTLRDHERRLVLRTLDELNGNKTRTAEVLGVSLRWLHYRLKEWKEENE